MRGWSLHWYHQLAKGLGVVDIGAAFRRSLALGGGVMLLTVVLSVLAGLAFRKSCAAAMRCSPSPWPASSCRPSSCRWASACSSG